MKKILAIVLALVLVLCAAAMAETSVNTTADEFELTGDPAAIKVGVILIGDENEGYTYAHMLGIQNAAEVLGLSNDQILWKYCVGEDASCFDALPIWRTQAAMWFSPTATAIRPMHSRLPLNSLRFSSYP